MPGQHPLSRTELLIGRDCLDRLRQKKVAVLGVGGVGSWAVEALARCGVGHLLIVDNDTVCLTNINRQLHATMATLGRDKVDVMRERIHDIDHRIVVDARRLFITPGNVADIVDTSLDYVVDAIDTITAKIALIELCCKTGIPVISCMGTGNKLDPTRFAVCDLYKTRNCPLARVMRNELRKRGVTSLKVVYSEETPRKQFEPELLPRTPATATDLNTVRKGGERRQVPSSISFVPPVAGFILAGEVIKDLCGINAPGAPSPP